jgi:hypothetical protein
MPPSMAMQALAKRCRELLKLPGKPESAEQLEIWVRECDADADRLDRHLPLIRQVMRNSLKRRG